MRFCLPRWFSLNAFCLDFFLVAVTCSALVGMNVIKGLKLLMFLI